MYKKSAFSLIELLISLIVISLVVAAFIPVLTKKMNHTKILQGSKLNLDSKCETFSAPEFDGNCDDCGKCKLCDGNKACIQCESKVCSKNEALDVGTCKCIKCNDESKGYSPDCISCTSDICLECEKGKYPEGKECKSCNDETQGYSKNCEECDSKQCTKCPDGYYTIENNKECQKCPEGCLACINENECTACGEGYSLEDGKCLYCVKNIAHCTQYSSNCKCIACEAGFHIDSEYSNYCWPNIETISAGDPGGVELPSNVRICNVGELCGEYTTLNLPTCFRKTQLFKDRSKTPIETYSKLTTVCNYAAAKLICQNASIDSSNTYVLPQVQHMDALRSINAGNDYASIVHRKYSLCNQGSSGETVTTCNGVDVNSSFSGHPTNKSTFFAPYRMIGGYGKTYVGFEVKGSGIEKYGYGIDGNSSYIQVRCVKL